ncbi:MAG: 1-deoxy-D-xylulose-5-phosphate reductoisomerase [Clostridiales bacterium]|nr:1-deoxy-D-xylulose-5-phosphate reductoisomerase [Clostridiales bacterium]
MLSVLGSTGNVGRQTLSVAEALDIRVTALAAHGDDKGLEEQARKFKPKLVALYDEKAAARLKTALRDTNIKVASGASGIIEAAAADEAETVVSAISGFFGLKPALAAIEQKKRLALANKETLVSAGEFIMAAASQYGAEIIPVDSEHSAIFQCLRGGGTVKRLLITASGGPFWGKTLEELRHVRVEDALEHPNWAMGAKITVDSATLMNKGLEVIEAMHLFNMPLRKISVLVHPQSIIHSMVEFIDGSVLAQLGLPDMRLPIQYALTYPNRVRGPVKAPDFTKLGNLNFHEPDTETFGCLRLAYEAAENGGTDCAVLNAANEVAVDSFLHRKIGFTDIYRIVDETLSKLSGGKARDIDGIIAADEDARRVAETCI